MISHDIPGGRFNLRAAAIIIRDGTVLVHRAETDDFWAMPGGRVECFEPTPETLRREMMEELGCEVRVERLLWIVENFFDYEEKNFHEIAFYHLVTLVEPVPERLLQKSFDGWEKEGSLRLLFEWMSLESLPAARLFPSFLRFGLQNLPDAPCHVVHRDTE